MRICLICTERRPVPPVRGGAIQTYLHRLAPLLARRHKVTVLCRTDSQLPERETVAGVRYLRVPAPDEHGYFRHVATVVAQEGPWDRVAVFNRPTLVPLVAEAAPGAEQVLSLHNDMLDPDRIEAVTARQVLTQCSQVVTVSDYVRLRVNRLYPGFGHKLRTIRAGVDPQEFVPIWQAEDRRRQVRRRLGLEGRTVVLFVGRLSPNKGPHLVVEAMALVGRTCPNASLLLVGSARHGSNHPAAYQQEVQEAARKVLGDSACFTGFVPPAEMPDLYLAGDVFVCASQWREPLARVHYEAMAAGLPLITTDRGGNGEVVTEGVNGLIVRPHCDAYAFARHLVILLRNPSLREQMGRLGRALVVQRYTWERVAADWTEVLTGT